MRTNKFVGQGIQAYTETHNHRRNRTYYDATFAAGWVELSWVGFNVPLDTV